MTLSEVRSQTSASEGFATLSISGPTRGGGEGSEVNGAKGKQPKFYIQRSVSMESSASPPSSPTAASSPSPSSTPQGRDNVWKSVFHPGNNINTKSIGSENFDKSEPNSPTVYDWFYSGETKSKRL